MNDAIWERWFSSGHVKYAAEQQLSSDTPEPVTRAGAGAQAGIVDPFTLHRARKLTAWSG